MNPFLEKYQRLDERLINWCQMTPKPYDKYTVDPYTRTRVILMNGTEFENVWFSHQFHRNCQDGDVRRALALAREYRASTLIDTILCLDGTEVIAACMASEMTKSGYMNINQNQDMNVLTPERSVGSQLIFRENTAPMINGKNVLILMASVSTGYTAKSAIETIAYYGGRAVGIASIFATVDTIGRTTSS